MKILIDKNFKAKRTGEYVSANAEAEELIVDTEACELSNTVLIEIAGANKITVSKKATKAELLENIEEGVKKLKLPTQGKEPESVKVARIVKAAYEAAEESGTEVDEDELLMSIIESGVKFKDAMKLHKQALLEGGFAVSNKDRTAECRKILIAADFQPKDWDDVQAMIDTLVDKVSATVESQAYAQIRKYAKEFSIALPKPEKKVSAGGFKAKIYAYMVKKPLATKEEFFQWVVEENDKEEKLANKYWETFELAKKVAQATIKAQADE